MNENEYIDSRVDDQIDWYDKKSQKALRWFKCDLSPKLEPVSFRQIEQWQ